MAYFPYPAAVPLAVAPSSPEQGYIGTVPDPTPNLHYTMPGVLAGLPTPETTRGRCQVRQPCLDEDVWES